MLLILQKLSEALVPMHLCTFVPATIIGHATWLVLACRVAPRRSFISLNEATLLLCPVSKQKGAWLLKKA